MGEEKGTNAKPRVLDSVRVLDFTQVLAGPYCTRLLVDLGAEVIKVEPPPPKIEMSRIDKQSLWWLSNCGKKSICLDLTKEKSVQIVHELVKKSDVVVENFRPGVMARLGVGYDNLREVNPKIIMCSLSAYGEDSMYSHLPGGALVPHAFSGYMWIQGKVADPDGLPMNCAFALGDVSASMYALSAICSALYFREVSGIGQHIDISLVDSLFALMSERVQQMLLQKEDKSSDFRGVLPIYAGKDGYVTMSGLTREQQARFYKAMGMEDLNPEEYLGPRQDELKQIITDWVQSFDSIQEVISIMEEADVICTPVLSLRQASTHPHFVAHGMTQEVDDPVRGKVKVINSPYRFSHSESGVRGNYPNLGEHNQDVLGSLLGYSAQEVDKLQEEGAIYSE